MTGLHVHARRATVVKLVLVAVIWGGTFIAGRVVTAEMPAAVAAWWRYVVASVALLVALLALERSLPAVSARQCMGIALLGATGVLAYNLCFMQGLKTVPASRASLIIALNPAMTAVGAAIFFHERLTRMRTLGIVLALAGAATVITHGRPASVVEGGVGTGEILIVGCVLSWVAYTLIGKRMLAGLSAVAASTYAAWAGTAMLALATLWGGDSLAPPPASVAAWASIAFLGVLGTAVAFVWYYEGVIELGAARAAVFINLVPVAAVTLGVLLLGEALEPATLVGGALVIAGIAALNRPSGRAEAPADERSSRGASWRKEDTFDAPQ